MLERYKRGERVFDSEWLPAPFVPPPDLTIQSSGICFTPGGRITMVSNGTGWVCPGGWPENGETLQEALVREVAEEACATVADCEYLGSIRTYERTPVAAGGRPLFYQARYWVRIDNGVFDPQFEMTQRMDFETREFVKVLRWNAKKTAELMLADALEVEQVKRGQGK